MTIEVHGIIVCAWFIALAMWMVEMGKMAHRAYKTRNAPKACSTLRKLHSENAQQAEEIDRLRKLIKATNMN